MAWFENVRFLALAPDVEGLRRATHFVSYLLVSFSEQNGTFGNVKNRGGWESCLSLQEVPLWVILKTVPRGRVD